MLQADNNNNISVNVKSE